MNILLIRQPIVIRAVIAIVIVAALRIGALVGWVPAEWVTGETAVLDWLDWVVGLWALWSAHRVVTPVAAPRDSEGRALVPAPRRPYSTDEAPPLP